MHLKYHYKVVNMLLKYLNSNINDEKYINDIEIYLSTQHIVPVFNNDFKSSFIGIIYLCYNISRAVLQYVTYMTHLVTLRSVHSRVNKLLIN